MVKYLTVISCSLFTKLKLVPVNRVKVSFEATGMEIIRSFEAFVSMEEGKKMHLR